MPHTFTLPNVRREIACLWHLAWPVLIGQLANFGMGVADVAMTGHSSADELAAVSLGASVWGIILVTVTGVMMAVNSIVAHDVETAQAAPAPTSDKLLPAPGEIESRPLSNVRARKRKRWRSSAPARKTRRT